MKIGDKLYCHKKLVMNNVNRDVNTTEGKYYTIVDIRPVVSENRQKIKIINDNGSDHLFDTSKYGKSYYKQWFYTENDIRKLKMDKLNKLNNLIYDNR